jgi:hypothetical protein
VLAELFGGRGALLDPPRPATIKSLIAFQAFWDRHPQLYDQICQVLPSCWGGGRHRHISNYPALSIAAKPCV